jgi:hypothetical protein
MLFEIAFDPNIIVDNVIGFNRYYLHFRRLITDILRDQLNELYSKLSQITISTEEDGIIWRWKSDGCFSIHSLYILLEYDGISNSQFYIYLEFTHSIKS